MDLQETIADIMEKTNRIEREPPFGSVEHRKNCEWMIKTIRLLIAEQEENKNESTKWYNEHTYA